MFHKSWNPWVMENGAIRRTSDSTFFKPLKYKKPIRILVCPDSDFFNNSVPQKWRKEAIKIMMKKPNIDFFIPSNDPDPSCMLPNTWIGLKIDENTDMENLLKTTQYFPFVNRWLYIENTSKIKNLDSLFKCSSEIHIRSGSFKPAYPCELCPGDGYLNKFMIQWIIISGNKPDALTLSKIREIHEYAINLNIPFYYKQCYIKSKLIREPFLDGEQYKEIPPSIGN